MLRYLIGISILTLGIIVIRALSDGKILHKYQYAFWIVIPLYMILVPFIKIDVPIEAIWNSLSIAKTDSVVYEASESESPKVITEDLQTEYEVHENKYAVNYEQQDIPEAINKTGQIYGNQPVVSNVKTRGSKDIETKLFIVSSFVSAILIVALITYNAGFILSCIHNRKYVGKDSSSGLKIYRIRHKETPFLLLNKIYVDNDPEKINKYEICHEVCHYKHGDYLWVLIRYLVLLLNWYNPFIWAAFILSGRDCELACDEEVMRVCGADSSKDYARTLVGILQQTEPAVSLTVSTGMRGGYEMMKKRVISIKKPARNSRKALALSMAALIMFTSCSFVNTSKNARKVSADSPWYNGSVYDIAIGTDPNRDIEGNDYDLRFAGADEKYLVVYATGDYEGTMDQKNTNWRDYVFGVVSIIDRNTKSVVNTIDVASPLDILSDEFVINVSYSNEKVTVKTSSKETVYDPSTLEVLDSRPVSKKDMFPLPDFYFYIGEYVIEARWNDNNGNGSFGLKTIAPNGDITSSELKEEGTNINSIRMFPLSGTKALFITNTSKGNKYFEYDLTANNVTPVDTKECDWIDLDQSFSALVSTDGKLYCKTDDKILKVDTSSKTVEEAFNYNWTGINSVKLKRFELVDFSSDTLLFLGQTVQWGALTASPKSFQIIELTKADSNPNSGKTILELYAPYVSEEIGAAIEKYNEENKKFFIEISERYKEKDYGSISGDWRNYSSSELKLNSLSAEAALSNDLCMDIISGKGPDILIGMSRYSRLNNSEYLVDLSPYVKKLDQSSYFTNIIGGSKTNGKLCQLPISIYIKGICTDQKFAGASGTGFTFEEYKNFVKGTLNGKDLITSGQALYFAELFNSMDDQFIRDGKVSFTGPEFAELAEYVRDNVPENGTSIDALYENGIYQYANYNEIQSYLDFYEISKQMRGLSNPTILGTPSLDGRGPLFTSSCSVAISAQAVNVDACGEFVKILLSDEIQTGIAMSGMGFVLNRNAFKTAGEGAITFCNNLDDDFGGSKVKLTTSDIDNLESIILSCSNLSNEDPDISIILIEEMPAYFLGQKDLDEVIKIAQDRAQKVLDERG